MPYAIPIPNSKTGHCAPFHHTTPAEIRGISQHPYSTMLLPEWAMLDCVQLTWPHANTDWNYMLKDVTECYIRLAFHIAERVPLIIVTPEVEAIRQLLKNRLPQNAFNNITFIECNTNDTWARDHAFLTCAHQTSNGNIVAQYLDFKFNGWGGKFEASLDNQINQHLFKTGLLKGEYIDHLDFELEGGSIESDGNGTLLTTSTCLLNPNRNPQFDKEQIELRLKEWFGVSQILWLNHGYLAGDDTDSHIDTLARLCPNETIAYVKCDDTNDEHYEALSAMEKELQGFQTFTGKPFRLIPLPMAKACYDEDGERLPATYANYLVVNNAVLFPTYNDAQNDPIAQQQLALAFPDYDIVGIDCTPLIRQHGSLHCATMQYPKIKST